jgi:hypothetical protein
MAAGGCLNGVAAARCHLWCMPEPSVEQAWCISMDTPVASPSTLQPTRPPLDMVALCARANPTLPHPAAACPRLLRETFEPDRLTPASVLDTAAPNQVVVEVGPRLNFSTAWSTNATSICSSVGLNQVCVGVGGGGRGMR